MDVTLRSVLAADGSPHARAATEDGVVAEGARRDKEDKYVELVGAARCRLVVMAIETGGRWSHEAADFIEQLAWARSRSSTQHLRVSAMLAWTRRWTRLLSVACSVSFARFLVSPPAAVVDAGGQDGCAPALGNLLAATSRDLLLR